MKKIVFLFLIALLNLNLSSQTLQTYNGVFENGKAVYQYYENETADRIYEGSFKYNSKIYTIIGFFKANKREGAWKITALNKVYSNEMGKVQLNTLVTGKYSSGNMDGLWNFSNSSKVFNKKTKKYNSKAEKIVASANFKDNHFVGKFTYDKTYLNKTKTTGQFDENGIAEGIWVTNYPKTVEEVKFNKGFAYSKLIKDITTGEKILFYDSLAFQEQFLAAYDSSKKMAMIDGKMYIVDTVEILNPALSVWQSDLYQVEGFGNIINPMYYYRKGKNVPHAYQLKIISCENNSDCHTNYLRQKNEEIERLAKEEYLLAEKLREETEEKEELARIEREKEEQRIRKENVINLVVLGDKLYQEKNYKNAILNFMKANEMIFSDEVTDKIVESQNQIQKIDSLHLLKNQLNNELRNRANESFAKTSSLELPLKNKKKIYAKNYILCVDYLKLNYNKTSESYKEMESNLDYWTEQDEQNLIVLYQLKTQVKEIEDFQNSVFDAVSNNNKEKLRMLNSSINPKSIINDFLNYKPMK
jgi:hypothetical protein